ncbi:MAG: hypothetical protein ACLT1L_02930 [Leuconostoc lactis]|uniref:Uncharacterized protein n=1 Tax=Leuconostoc lactis TaxID=1246 RepID=A0AAP9ECA5_LEULA|nr:hypothetical protein [Leuconostoc lactis]MBA5812660.1 hypothetical protein [Leuconostoc lactis]MCC2744574.1 hypothetical protein [Leuconostoc lactis]MCC2755112.1 hypothetical protein [Leuconostoc lactis]MSB66945.1 hypothetical protein [Leuconostoc lactis]QEA43931.1 hypothetical protein FGL83_04305 [Leuconostoc lactis]
MDKLLTFILIIAAPFIVIGIVYLFGWLLTGLIMLFGVSYASARLVGIALAVLISFGFIGYQGFK